MRSASARLQSLLDELDIAKLAKSKAGVLSGGERRRVEITRALVLDPRFLCLDEPFAGIDPITVVEIQRIITYLKERGIGVLMSDHNVQATLSIIDRAYVIHGGKILFDGVPERYRRERSGAAGLSGRTLQAREIVRVRKNRGSGRHHMAKMVVDTMDSRRSLRHRIRRRSPASRQIRRRRSSRRSCHHRLIPP